jgi:ribonuclease HI
VKDGITKWIANWKKNNWKNSQKKDVKNRDLWEELDNAIKSHQIQWKWVKGHAGNIGNERADELARKGVSEQTD